MIFLGDSIAVIGLDLDYEVLLKDGQNGVESSNFYMLERGTGITGTIADWQLVPVVSSSEVKFIACAKYELLKGKRYNINGTTTTSYNGPVYISPYNGSSDFIETIKYETKTKDDGSFDFGFDSELQDNTNDTVIIVWIESNSLLALINSEINIKCLDYVKENGLVYIGDAAPVEPTDSLNYLIVKVKVQNVGLTLEGVLIYEEDSLSDAAKKTQQIITNGFTKLENGETLSEEEYNNFRYALDTRRTGSKDITGVGEYTLEIYQEEEEKDLPVSYFYIWTAKPGDLSEDATSTITITLDEQGEKNVEWGTCLAGETPIAMANGSQKRLDELIPGDLVQDINGHFTKVLKVNHGTFNPYHTLYYFEGDIVIDEISTHRFFNVEKGFWEHLKKWRIGDHALDINGEKRALLRKQRIYERKENFGLDTESGRYFANNLLSGPARCNQTLLKNSSLKKAVEMVNSIKEFQSFKLINSREIL